MQEVYADSGFRLTMADRLECIAQRLEGTAWFCLVAGVGFAGYLVISL
jgi:hypothetical protein